MAPKTQAEKRPCDTEHLNTERNLFLLKNTAALKILFVCMGNICRSPLAEAVFRHHVLLQGLESKILTDSAGTHGYHVGAPPDIRAQQVAKQRGYAMDGIFARQISSGDFRKFDFVLAMDHANLVALNRLRPMNSCAKLSLLTRYCETPFIHEVPDPYYGSIKDFERTLDAIENSARYFLAYLRRAPD